MLDAIFNRLRMVYPWQVTNAAMTEATLDKEETEPNPTGRAKCGLKRGLSVENYLAILHVACAWFTYRAAGLLG